MSAITEYFPPDCKPVHAGTYESYACDWNTNADNAHKNAIWDGKQWVWSYNGEACFMQRRYWRGLAAKPQPDQPAQEVDK